MAPRTHTRHATPAEIDADGAERAIAAARDAGIPIEHPGVRDLVARIGSAAAGVLPALLRDPELARTMADELATRGHVAPALPPAPPTEPEPIDALRERLRRMRNAALVRTALRELYADADVDTTAREWSHVASVCTEHALAAAAAQQEARNGVPTDERGARVPFCVLGMGKLGGEELNLGSDIDICYFYGTDDGAAGERTLNEHFSRVGAHVAEHLEEVTELGFAFRVDLRLRPEGSRGPLANSLASAERYYETWGRSWERAALLRARPIAGDRATGEALLAALRPFIYRRAVDPSIAVDMAQMLDRARRELLQNDARDLKLGRGGIREAEFFVQTLQLIWGGRNPSLQVPNTPLAVTRLRALGLLSHREAQAFSDAWALLRRVEHRVQSMASYATHLLPDDDRARRALARSLAYPSWEALLAALTRARTTVRELFATLRPHDALGAALTPPPPPPESVISDLVARGASREAIAEQAAAVLEVRDPEGAAEDLLRLARRADMPLGVVGRDRDPTLGPRLLAEVRDAPDPDRALSHLADLFGRMRRSELYARRLADAPAKARGLVGLFGASETLSKTLLARPDLIDAVVAGGAGAPTDDEIHALITAAATRAGASPDDDPIDATIGALRRVQREVVLQVGLADMAGALSEADVSARLSALAEGATRAAFELAAREAAERFGTRPGAQSGLDGVAVFALGSLAASELGYGGDVDLIVLYDREDETRGGKRAGVTMAEFVARMAQRAILFLSAPHAEGPGYAVDTRLRPSGSQGTLVVSLEGFQRYHARETDAPGASSWERQALIRARQVAGDRAFGELAREAIERVAYTKGPPDVDELVRLRQRIERERGAEARGEVSLKDGAGSLVDIEFAAQALQMAHGRDASVRTPTTRRAVRALRDAGFLAPHHADALLEGEGLLRRALLASRLVAERGVLVPGSAATMTIARKLGYRTRGGRAADDELLADLAAARARVRRAFEEVTDALRARVGADASR